MNKSFFITILGAVSTIASIVGIIFFFIDPTVTIICAIISALNSILQIALGDQNNITTEIVTIIIAVIVALIMQKTIFPIICFALCLVDALMSILGWISMFAFYKSATKFDKSASQTDENYKELFGNPSDFINISFMSDKEKSDFQNLSKAITTTEKTYQDALNNLGDLTENDIELLYKNNIISNKQYSLTKSSYESLLFIKETYPNLITEIKVKRRNLYSDSLLSAYENGKLDKEVYLHLLENLNFL